MGVDLKEIFRDAPAGSRFLGVVGHPLAHTLSPAMHTRAAWSLGLKAAYRAMPVAPDDWDGFLEQARALPLDGFNVTVPYKERFRHEKAFVEGDALARHALAVNTVRREGDRWVGHNTDGSGFLEDLAAQGMKVDGRKVALLGVGGSARAILFALHFSEAAPARVTLVNRALSRGPMLLDDFEKLPARRFPALLAVEEEDKARAVREADLVVNATSVGLAPGLDYPIDLAWLRAGQDVYDLIYHRETALMAAARKAGARVSGGLGMLVRQGALAFKIWFGAMPSVDLMRAAAEEELKKRV